MSLGYLGRCHLEDEDEKYAVYSYSGENWNLDKAEAAQLEAIVGAFTISKGSLEEPEVHVKRVRKPNGRKVLQEKVITHVPSIGEHVRAGGIVIDELCGVDRKEFEETGSPLPRIVRQLLYKVFEGYMQDGKLPVDTSFIQ